MKHTMTWVTAAFCFILLLSTGASANKSSVKLEAPSEAKKGETVTIVVNISHNGNSYFHYTNWVSVKANGKEIQRWEFAKSSRPEGENFRKEIPYTVNETVEIEAEANCNIHGSNGPDKITIKAK